MPNPFQWLQNLGREPAVEASPPARKIQSLEDMEGQGWISPQQAETAGEALRDLEEVIRKAGWKLSPRYADNAVRFLAPDGKVPFLLAFRDGKTGFFLCVRAIEDPVVLEELPRDFQLSAGEGGYRGVELKAGRINLRRYVSVLGNVVRLGACRE